MLRFIGNRSLNTFRSILINSSRSLSTMSEKTVNYDVVKKMSNEKQGVVIDVRNPDELKEHGEIPNSVNIPLDQLKNALADSTSNEDFKAKYGHDKPSKSDGIVTSCMAGRRAEKAMKIAEGEGYTNVKFYAGSWTDWAKKEGLAK